MIQRISARKREHLEAIARDLQIERASSGFDDIRLIHRALPDLNLDDIDTRCTFLGKTLSFPLIISSMTGGDDEALHLINQRLAQAAEFCGIAMAVGSQRIMFDQPNARRSFQLRQYAPETVLLANLGAVQLNKGFDIKHCQAAVDILQADGLYLHLNPLQEAIQPEGDTDFKYLDRAISIICEQLDVPVLLKEVGCGLSLDDITMGKQAGVSYFDLAGRGGTSWSRIEYHRRQHHDDDLGLIFQDWGLTTIEALKMAKPVHQDVTFIASGGVRNGIDIAKAVTLGAQMCGIAAPLLEPAQHSTDAVIRTIEKLQREYQTAMFLLGCQNHYDIFYNHSLLLS
ncbi:MAG: type 2 isopentenyl-diphosphate Delta-isomerase [Cardiobacteriales bacterium]|nr:MAG: type 2 isopentenyl-diphosphate Delta-isomerase [Cardiobacteriales bacterium]